MTDRHDGWQQARRRGVRVAVVGLGVLLALSAAGPAPAQECTGDCNDDNTVTIDEVVTMVGMALGSGTDATCRLGDVDGNGEMTVDEIVKAVALTLSSLGFEANGTCMVPSNDTNHPLQPCADGTWVRAYRCIDRERCLAEPSARRQLGRVQIPPGGNGAFEFTGIADCYGGSSTFVFEAEPEPQKPEETYRVVDFGVVRARARSATGIVVEDVLLSPITEATVRLVDENGLENFGQETFDEVLTAVSDAIPPESLVGQGPGQAANTATTTAREDAEVQAVIATVLRHDVPASTSIDPLGNVDLYKLTLHETTPIVLQMTRSSGTITPCLEVRVSGGTEPVPNGRVCAAPAARLSLLLAPGTYYVFAEDEGSDGIGSYDLIYLRVTDGDAEPLEPGVPVNEAIGPVGDIDPYTFRLTTCSVVTVRGTRVTGTVSPCLELRQAGANGPVDGRTGCGAAQETINLRLNAGRYVLLVSDAGNDDVGSYTVSLLVAEGCTPTPTPSPARTATPTVTRTGTPTFRSQVWDASADYSGSSNPSGAWSYGRKSSVTDTGFDIMPQRWGSSGWILAWGLWQPSIQAGPLLWPDNNSHGYPVVRWTCPSTGYFYLDGMFAIADGRGGDNFVYLVINGSTQFTDHIVGYPDSAPFAFDHLLLQAGDTIDLIVVWNSATTYRDYGWTLATLRISSGVPRGGTSARW